MLSSHMACDMVWPFVTDLKLITNSFCSAAALKGREYAGKKMLPESFVRSVLPYMGGD